MVTISNNINNTNTNTGLAEYVKFSRLAESRLAKYNNNIA